MKTLVLVEDNQDNADLICDLAGNNYQVVHYPDGPSALAALNDGAAPPPNILLLDISLPGMDGRVLLQHLRACDKFKDIPAIALTAHAMKDDRANLLAAGFNGYVSKPITDEAELFRTIDQQLAA